MQDGDKLLGSPKIKQIYMYIVGRRLYPNIILHVYVEYVNLYDLHLKQNGVLYANVGSAWTTFVGVITVGKFSVVSVSFIVVGNSRNEYMEQH